MATRPAQYLRAVSLPLLGALLAFVLLTALHATIDTRTVSRLDLRMQSLVHDTARPWLTPIMLTLTWIGAVRIFLVATAVTIGGLWFRARRHAATVLSTALAGALLLNQLLKLHFHRARPVVPWSIGDESTYSFPSGHALFATTLYMTLAYLALPHAHNARRRATILLPAILLPVGIGLSRIYLGMHFPSDVLAGYLCGAAWTGSVVLADRSLSGR